jgi:hypothetical protein
MRPRGAFAVAGRQQTYTPATPIIASNHRRSAPTFQNVHLIGRRMEMNPRAITIRSPLSTGLRNSSPLTSWRQISCSSTSWKPRRQTRRCVGRSGGCGAWGSLRPCSGENRHESYTPACRAYPGLRCFALANRQASCKARRPLGPAPLINAIDLTTIRRTAGMRLRNVHLCE